MKNLLSLIFTVFFLYLLAPDKNPRRSYLRALESFEGEPYAPAGEGGGISCSELVRGAYLEAAVSTESKEIVRRTACLSEELRAGCFDLLRTVTASDRLRNVDQSLLMPGDVAVLGGAEAAAIHTVAYLGDGVWIHADPIKQIVTTFKQTDPNIWFVYPVRVMRWRAFEEN